MSHPDYEAKGYKIVNFYDKDFHNLMVRFLGWLEEPVHVKYTRPDGKLIELNYTNDFYVLHDTLRIEVNTEMGDYDLSILQGEPPK